MNLDAAVALVHATGLHGDISLLPSRYEPPGFPTLCRIIAFQQLSGAQALKMCQTVEKRFPAFPEPRDFTESDAASVFIQAGVAPFRVGYMVNLAYSVTEGLVRIPDTLTPTTQKDLTRIKGIGPWTAEMYRLFALRDLDVWPLGDVGLRKGLALHRGCGPEFVRDDPGSEWAGARSVATWFLWQRVPGFPTPGFRPSPPMLHPAQRTLGGGP